MTTKINLLALMLQLAYSALCAHNVPLHVSNRWKECSFQLDPSLTQQEWHEFTQEAGMVACYRPLVSAKALGVGRFEVSLLQWKTGIDETKGAWNNTFVHPDEEHYLVGGEELPFPGLQARVGLTKKLDAGVYWSMRPGANYGFIGAQLQYNFLQAEKHHLDVSSRLGFNKLYGPEDLNFTIYSLDLLASKKFNLYKSWLSISPYIGGSAYLSNANEKTDRVSLKDENVIGSQVLLGAVLGISNFTMACEYNKANVNSLSIKLGYTIKLWKSKNYTPKS
jgi:hypothetical protein